MIKISTECDICKKKYRISKGTHRFIGLPFLSTVGKGVFGGRSGFSTTFRCESCEARLDVAVYLECQKILKETPKQRDKALRKIKKMVKKNED